MSLETEFREHAEKWARDTRFTSSTSSMIKHPSYQTIVAMGYDVVPLLLQDLRDNGRFWFWALTEITGDNPIDPADAGVIKNMTNSWLDWGIEKGLLEEKSQNAGTD